jgi:hypothetical protein
MGSLSVGVDGFRVVRSGNFIQTRRTVEHCPPRMWWNSPRLRVIQITKPAGIKCWVAETLAVG